jgi:ubiquinone/menaquinone biosynthesis C-methylase UbiE
MDINNEKEKVEKLWNKEAYYKLIQDCQAEGEEGKFFAYKILEEIKKNSCNTVLDVGCGEGIIIDTISKGASRNTSFFGIDVAGVGISMANQRKLPNAEFKIYDGNRIPFDNGFFDCVYSTFVFEHLTQPELIFKEMSRVTKKSGIVIVACPNYGSPFFRSPCNKENKVQLMLRRIFASFGSVSGFKDSFGWQKVEPLVLSKNEHIMDYDTTIEPNLLFFINYLKANKDFSILVSQSFWDKYEYGGKSRLKNVFMSCLAFLGKRNFPVIKYYGPFFYIVLKKLK